MTQLRLTLLGSFAAHRSDGAPLALRTRKDAALLALLACRAGEAHNRERITALLWGDRGDQQALHSLSQALTSIRRAFGGTASFLLVERQTIALCPSAVDSDVAEFQRLSRGDCLEDLQAAIALYRGPLLEGIKLRESAFEEWLAQERARLHELAITVLRKLARCHAVRGDVDGAIAALERALALDPLAETTHRQLIQLHLDRGLYNVAIRRYRQCRDQLKRELDTSPEPATMALYHDAMRGLHGAVEVTRVDDPTPQPPAPRSPSATTDPTRSVDCQQSCDRRPSIAVMAPPGRDAGLGMRDVLADGLCHDVITRLAKLRSLFVIARGTVLTLGERNVEPQEVGRLLKVDYVAGITVRRVGNRIAVTAELAETVAARIVWAEIYHHKLADTFLILEEIGNKIVTAIANEIEMAERNRAILKPPNSLDAWEAYHRGLWHMYRFNKADNDQAQHFFRMAVGRDPTFSRGYAGLSFTHFQNAFLHRVGDRERESASAFDFAGQGLMADDRDPAAHWAMGRALWLRGRQDESLAELAAAVALSPNFALAYYQLAFIQCQSGDAHAAIKACDHSRNLSPFDPLLFAMLATRALAHVRLGQFDLAAEWSIKAAARHNAHAHIQGIAAQCLAAADRLDEARDFMATIRKTTPHYGIDDFLGAFQFSPDTVSLFRENARRIGVG